MNLADMLCYADIHELSRIARHYECQCSSHSKHELIQSILSAVGRKEAFEASVTGLEQDDIRFLNALLFDRRETFSLEELLARASSTRSKEDSGPDPRELIARFRQRGWLFNGFSQDTRYLFQVPEDLRKRFSDTLARVFARKLVYTGRTPRVYRDEQDMLANDIAAFLRHLAGGSMPLNAEGFLYKRQLQDMTGLLAVREEPVPKAAWRFGYGRRYKEYPIRFSFLYDYCFYSGLIVENGHQLDITPAGRIAIEENRCERTEDLYAFWLRLYRGPIPALPSITHWLQKLAGKWTTAESLYQLLCPLIKPYYYDTPQDILGGRVLPMLMHLGLCRLGTDDDYGAVVQVTKLGERVISGTKPSGDAPLSLEDG